MTSSLCIAFVDPIISPAYLADILHRQQIKIVAIFTLQVLEEEKNLRIVPEMFDQVIYCDETDDLSPVAKTLKDLGVKYIFYGYEGSVYFTDLLANLVCPEYSNDPATAKYRNDKSEMQEGLKKNHLPSVNQIKIDVSDPSSYQNKLEKFKFPVIIKPIHGGLSIGVKKCNSINDIEDFIKKEKPVLLHSEEANEYVVQEFLEGREYFVDTVSLSGEHFLVGVQAYEKTYYKGTPIYRFVEIIDVNSKEWKICTDFVLEVLDALGLKNGFGHTEIFITSNGPYLIEINPRISGISGFANILTQQTLHTNQPEALLQIINHVYKPPTKMFRYGRIVLLQNWTARTITQINVDLLKKLTSYQNVFLFKKAGDFVGSPKSLRETVGLVLLVAAMAQQDQLINDYEQLIHWEKNNELF